MAHASVPLGLLYRQHAWAKLFSASGELPTLTGAMWQATFDQWLQARPRGGGTPPILPVARPAYC
eukprot:6242649-Prymnesium_polylepis.1